MDIQEIVDRAEILDVTLSYGRGMDRGDGDLLRSRYHPGAIEDRGKFLGLATDFVDWILDMFPREFVATQHMILNPIVEVRGNEADVEAYFLAYHRTYPAGQKPGGDAAPVGGGDKLVFAPDSEVFMGGRYLFRFEKRGGAWKITYCKNLMDWVRSSPLDSRYADENPGLLMSVRSPDDSRIGSPLHPMLPVK